MLTETKPTVVATRSELASLIRRSLAGEEGGGTIVVLAPELLAAEPAA